MPAQTAPIRRLLTLAALILSVIGALPAVQRAAVDSAVIDVMARDHVPAISVGIARGRKMLYARGYGYRDLRNKLPADDATVYEVGSLTKQFTAALILQLVHQRELSLEDPISKYVHNYPAAATITLRQLLNQVSGVPDYSQQSGFRDNAYQELTPAQLVATVSALPLDFAPGSKWEYSNTNYVLLGMVIEAVTGQAYANALRTRLLEPLHLTATNYTDPASEITDRALGYSWSNGSSILARPAAMSVAYSAGALSSNVRDLLTWDTDLFSNGVLPANLTNLMMMPALLSDGSSSAYGFGLQLERFYGRLGVMHAGQIFGFSSFNVVFPDSKLQIVILGNSDTFASAQPLAKSIAAILDPPSNPRLEVRTPR
ncbi:MAG: beta-lactamase family protein [Candidatus Eremiobacteraeota bacterium]|nr:beta-lactamase family protein [Candidatus Eremiobacteraeota bacterium]